MNLTIPLIKIEEIGKGIYEDMKIRESCYAYYEGSGVEIKICFAMPTVLVPKAINI
jgi:hypothetical protein